MEQRIYELADKGIHIVGVNVGGYIDYFAYRGRNIIANGFDLELCVSRAEARV